MLFLWPKIVLPTNLRNTMHRIFVFSLALALISPGLFASEKLVISRWLAIEPVELNYPVFHEVKNTQGKTFTDRDLLGFDFFDLGDYFPEEGLTLGWTGLQQRTWSMAPTDENGYLVLGGEAAPGKPQMTYLAAYIRADRWLTTQLEIKSPYMLEAWLNGKRIGTKTSMEEEENTVGRVSQQLKLPRGNHLLVIKTLRPPKDGLQWKVMANLEVKDPYSTSDLVPNLRPETIKNISHVMDGVKVGSVNPSPDGRFYLVNYSRSLPPSDQSESWSEVKSFTGNRLVHSFRHARVSRLSWLPKSNAVSFTSTRDGKSAIHWQHMETGEQRIIMEDVENLAGFRWSPDESYIIYTLREDGKGADATMRQVLGMQDRPGHWRHRSFLYKLDLASGIRTRLTHGNITTSLHDISPDGRQILFSQSRPDYQERPYAKHELMLLDLQTLEVDTLLSNQRWGVSASFSPDGRQLLATGGPSAFDGAGVNVPEGTIPNNYDTQAYIYDLGTRTEKCITLNFDPSVSSVSWHPQTNQVFILTVDEDYQRIYSYDPRSERFSLIETGVDYAAGMNFADHAPVMTFMGNQTNAPRRVYKMNLRNQRVEVLEDTESSSYRLVRFGETGNWDFVASTGVEVKGRYYLPPDFDPGKKYPVIVYYYGGTTPVGRTFGGRYPFNLWAGNGYVVYVLQPSGATGFGQEFSAAHVNNWGITVADEIIEGTKKFLEAHPFTDPARVGCAGASYGGFMTMLLMTRTDIFAAAISHAGISSISSYWGEGYWGYSYSAEATAESFPWNSPEIYVGQSPLFHADKIHTPLLLITGDSDTNVPPGESIQLFTALKILGRPVELVLVKGEDHHIVTYNKRIQWHNTIMAWWDKYLKDQPQWWEDQYPPNNY
jgi:dipeptidyl aminopeptidase/acylaminoacyl peptidase